MKTLKLAVLLLICFMATGCVTRMDNDNIIAEAIKCERVGLPWRQTYNYDGTIRGVHCTPLGSEEVFKKRY